MSFIVDEKLLENNFIMTDLELSRVLFKNDKDNPWFILIPRKKNATELIDLNAEQQSLLMEEVTLVSHFIKEFYRPHKINVASLGNVVKQLHIHVVGRYEDDRAWPNAIFSSPVLNCYEEAELHNVKSNFLEFVD